MALNSQKRRFPARADQNFTLLAWGSRKGYTTVEIGIKSDCHFRKQLLNMIVNLV